MRNISSKTLITFLIISLTGIIGMQTYLFQNSIKVKEDQFDQNALSAMNVISSRLEKMDAMNTPITVAKKPIITPCKTSFLFIKTPSV